MKTGSLLTIILFALVALAHLLRLVTGAEIVVDGSRVPQWVSVGGVLIPGLLAWQLWREAK